MDTGSVAIKPRTYTLHELMQSVQAILNKTYSNRFYWIRCELSRISLHAQSGHCYLELVEKSESSILAQQRGIIWSERYNHICGKFQAVTNTPLSNGMKVLLQCSVSFHPVHGLSLIVADIEPSFTLGEMARAKNESIERLKKENLFYLNQKLRLSILPKRIAIVSVATSRGYQDFMSTLINHNRRYAVNCTLFDAVLQGENAVPSLIRALKQIAGEKEKFDAIAIIRGGAGDTGLACYDDYSLSSLVAQLPLPVITGIGHASNETVTEMVAFKNCITPTAAAAFILEKFDEQFAILSDQQTILAKSAGSFFRMQKQSFSILSERIFLMVNSAMHRQDLELKNLLAGMPAYLSSYFSIANQRLRLSEQTVHNTNRFVNLSLQISNLKRTESELKSAFENYFERQRTDLSEKGVGIESASEQLKESMQSLSHLSEKISLLDPVNILRRGYSITRLKGKALMNAAEISEGALIETELSEGKLISRVENKK